MDKYSDLAQPLAQAPDYSDLAQPLASETLVKQANEQGEPKVNDPWKYMPRSPIRSLIEMNQAMRSPKTAAQYGVSTLGDLGMLAVPEFRMMAGEGLIPGAANMLGRTLAGTAATTASQAPEINSMNDFNKSFKQNLGWNALLEGATTPFRGASSLAELQNPIKYANKKAGDIRNEFQSAKTLQNETYKPVFDKYGSYNVTLNPEKYLNDLGIKEKGLYSEAKELYKKFKNEPTFQNLHNLQSKIGQDLRSAQVARNKPASVSRFKSYNKKLNNKVSDYLKHDPEMLDQYNKGREITKNVVSPYEANKDLEKIIYGTKEGHTPKSVLNAIKKGTEKITSKKGLEAFTAIPEGHPLRNHLKDIGKRLNIGSALGYGIPTALGGLAGEYLHPGMGGVIGALAAPTLKAMAGKHIGGLSEQIQNPLIENAIKKLSIPYYIGGRNVISGINK